MGNSPSFTGGSQYVKVFRGRGQVPEEINGGCDTCGGDNFIGGDYLASISDYDASANSKVKSEIVDEAIKIANSLGLKVPTTGDDMTKAKGLLAALPKDTLKVNNVDAHVRTCKAIAAAINKIYGTSGKPEPINVNLAPELICQHVGEFLHSLVSGMYNEYLGVQTDVKRAIKNLHQLGEATKMNLEQEKNKVKASTDPYLYDQLAPNFEVEEMIIAETKHQLTLLQNLMQITLTSADIDLVELIKASKGLSKNIAKIDVKLGTDGFGKIIANVLQNIGITAATAARIDKALKEVGMTMDEYKKLNTTDVLQDKIASGVIGKNRTPEQEHEYLKAVAILQENLTHNKDIPSASGAVEDNDNIMIGGDEFAKTTMDRRVADRKAIRNILFKAFYKQINGLFNQFVASLNAMSDKVGTSEFPPSEQLNDLRRVLHRLSDELFRNKQIYYALIGYYNDALSKSKRDEVIADLKVVATYVETLIELPQYAGARQYLQPIITHINAINNVIDKYTAEITAKFGRGEDCPYLEERSGGIDDEVESVVKFKPKHTVVDAITKLDYKIRVSQIKANLSAEGKELDSYNEKYEKLIAASIADILKTAQNIYETLCAELEKEAFPGDQTGPVKINGFFTEAEWKEQKAAARKFLDEQWEVKKKFWATIEAVDSYMQVFTNQLVKNPEDVKEIKSMLDEIETIPDWYSELTGNETCNTFEAFPTALATANGPDVNATQKISVKVHYYDAVKASRVVGNPHIVANPVDGIKALDAAKRTMGSLSILKNLLSVFVHIGSTFGGKELRKQIFMTPTQMYNNLVDYLQASAFAQGWKTKSNGILADKVLPDTFNDNTSEVMSIKADFILDPTASSGINIGVHTVAHTVNSGQPDSPAAKAIRFRKRWGVWMRSVISGLKGEDTFSFDFEDKYFVLIMKALSAKILTVTGLYDVFDRPLEYNGFSPIRMILGGNVQMPKIDPEAVPLYLRLPLLAQFYRDIFGFAGAENPDNIYSDKYPDLNARRKPEDHLIKISMVPDDLGIFTELINIVFKKNKYLQTTMYNDDDTKSIIAAINTIYQKMAAKHPKNTIMETINEFVAEINRRYGIVSKYERDLYEREFGPQYDYGTDMSGRYTDAPDNNYAILPGEEDEEIVRPSAAQRLLGATFDVSKTKKSPFTITADHEKLVYGFRCAIDKYFENPDEAFSFENTIRSAKQKLLTEPNDENRFNIVAALIRGVDMYTKVDDMKFVLFHETVVGGLNTLSAIHTILARFKRRALCIDHEAIEDAVWAAIDKSATTNANLTAIRDQMLAKFEENRVITKGTLFDNVEEISELIEKILGSEENSHCNGGSGIIASAEIKLDGIVPSGANRSGSIIIGADKKITTNGTKNSIFRLFETNKAYTLYQNAHKSNDKSDERKRMTILFRYLINRDFVMRELVELVLGFSGDLGGLVSCKIEEDKVYLNYGNLKNLIDQLFAQVGYFADLLRSHISVDLMKKYMDKTASGSYYWLYEQIMEKIIIGRPESELTDLNKDVPRHGYDNLDQIAQKLSYTWQKLTQRFDVDGAKINTGEINNATDSSAYNHFDKVFAEMVFYDGSKPQSGLIRDGDANNMSIDSSNTGVLGGCEVVDYLYDPFESLHFSGPAGAKIIDTRFIARFKQLYSWKDKFTLNRSALYSFNQLVQKYIQSFYDPVSGKIYGGLLNNFANGSFNRAIADPLFTYPDTLPAWFVKTNPTDYKIPSTHLLALELNDTKLNNIKSDIEAATISYAITGAPLGYQTKLFSANNNDVTGKVGGTVPQLYYNIMFHVIAIELQKFFTTLKNMDLSTSPGTGPYTTNLYDAFRINDTYADYGLLLRAYNAGPDNIPTISQIVVFLNNKIPLTNRIRDFVAYINNNAIILSNIGTIYPLMKRAAITDAIELFPFTDSHGGTEENTKYRAQVFANLWLRISQIKDLPQSLGYVKELNELKKAVFGTKSTYSPSAGKLEYLVKYDDMLKSNTEFTTTDYIPDNNDFGYVVLASDEGVSNAFPAGALKGFKLGSAGPGDSHKRKDIVNYGCRKDADADHVLFTSLSIIIKSLMTSKSTTNQAVVNMFENVADVPIYIKEKMRANLPAFRALFKTLIARCEAMRKIMNKCNLERQFPNTVPNHNPWPYQLRPVIEAATSEAAKARFTGILDKIIEGSNSLILSIDQSLREVGDEPKYFELSSGSIKDYRAQNGVDPFMPLTTALSVFKNATFADHTRFVPIHMVGNDNFKFAYGTRALLSRQDKVTAENVLGFSQIVDGFNLITDVKLNAKKEHAADFLAAFVTGVRFIHELKNMKGLLTPYVSLKCPNSLPMNADELYSGGAFIRGNLITSNDSIDNRAAASIYVGNNNVLAKAAFSIAKNLADSIKLTESSFRDEKIKEFVEYFITKAASRNSLAIQNIIDLNIVPISVHALTRSIPLANLYNYGYTFDRLIIELYYGLRDENARKLIRELCPYDGEEMPLQSAKDMLVSLLLKPYRSVKSQSDRRFMREMMLGVPNNGELGRPKFLSDQLYNKALFGSQYESTAEYNEMGPAASAAVHDERDLAVQIANIVFGLLNSSGVFINRLFATGPDARSLNQAIVKTIVDRIYYKPKIASTELSNEIEIQILTSRSNPLSAVRTGDSDQSSVLAIVCLEVKKLIDNMKKSKPSEQRTLITNFNREIERELKLIDGRFGTDPNIVTSIDKYLNSSKNGFDTFNLTSLDKAVGDPNKDNGVGRTLNGPNDNFNVMDASQIHSFDDLPATIRLIGELRFDTIFIRNLIFITNLYRSVRMKLHRDLVYNREVVTRSLPITRADLTEFYGNAIRQNPKDQRTNQAKYNY